MRRSRSSRTIRSDGQFMPLASAGHDRDLSRVRRRRGVGRGRFRPGHRPALRQRQRDGMDGRPGAERKRRAAARPLPAALRVLPPRRSRTARRRSSRRSSGSAHAAHAAEIDGGRSARVEAACRGSRTCRAAEASSRSSSSCNGGAATTTPRQPTRSPLDLQYRFTGYDKFLDPDGYPAVAPPWGTLTAIDLNTGEHRVADPARRISRAGGEGHEEHGQRELRRPDRDRGRAALHRRDELRPEIPRVRQGDGGSCCGRRRCRLPATRTPATYEVDGRQFVVIAAGGGKGRKGTPSGGTYVAFALPAK